MFFTSVRWNKFEFLQKRRIRCLWGHGLENSVSTWRTAQYNFKLSLITIVGICKLSASPCKLKQALLVILQEKARLISEGCMQNELINSRLEPRTPNASHRSIFCNSVKFPENLWKNCKWAFAEFYRKIMKTIEIDMLNSSVEINISLQMWRPPGPQF